MKFEDYTKEQQQAIITKGTNIIVSAGAGSGKTQVLTERVIHFIKNEGYKLNEFLILTFTRLAASEMKERIRKALIAQNLEEANEVDYADICTFDSYALAIVKKYHFLLNIAPDVNIIDSNIIMVKKITILNEIFEEKYKNKDESFLSLIRTFCFKNDDDIKKIILKLYAKALLEIDTTSFLDNFISKYYSMECLETLVLDTFNNLKDEASEMIVETATLPNIILKDDITIKKTYCDFLNDLLKSKNYDEFMELSQNSPSIRLPKGTEESDKKVVDKFRKTFNDYIKRLNSYPNTKDEIIEKISHKQEYSEKIIEIVKKLDCKVMAYKRENNVYEFNDIAKMALNLVKNNEEIRLNIKNNLKMIMIDEYQDTSLLQDSFVSLIANDNVYMVGDVKQSIYLFRNARCDIFIDKYQKYKNHDGGIAIDLNTNFRSRQEVLADINYIFSQLMTLSCGGADYKNDHLIAYGNKSYILKGKTNQDYHLDILTYKKKKSMDQYELEAREIAEDIVRKINNGYKVFSNGELRTVTFSDFCILMDRGSAFQTFAKIFNEYDIPLYIEDDENISKNMIVILLTNVLRLIRSIQNNDYSSKEFLQAFLSVSRSFIFQYSDSKIYDIFKKQDFYNEELIANLRNIIFNNPNLSIYELVEKIIFDFDIYTKTILIGDVEKNEKYIDTFLQLFASMSEIDYTIDDFIVFMEYIDDYELKITLSASSANIDSVKIMNIHKSKGLEFSFIYMAGLYRNFNRRELEDDFGFNNKYGLYFPEDDKSKANIIQNLNKKYEIAQDTSEKVRLFYVMLTRTKEKMTLVMEVNGDFYTNAYIADSLSITQDFYLRHHIDEDNIDESKYYYIGLLALKAYFDKEINHYAFIQVSNKVQFTIPKEFNLLSLDEQYKYILSEIAKIEKA